MEIEKMVKKLRLLSNGVPLGNITFGCSKDEIKKMFSSAANAMQNQIPNKVIKQSNGNIICPICECEAILGNLYCWNCGQKLQWK